MSAVQPEKGIDASPTTISSEATPAAPVLADEAVNSQRSSNVANFGNAAPPHAGKPKGRTCGVCNDHEAKYKCSRCQLPYCSVACATLHRATHPVVADDVPTTTVEVEPAITANGTNVNSIAGTLSAAGARNPFSVLEDAKDLQTLFMVYPRLRAQLREIYSATLPPGDEFASSTEQYENHPQSYRGGARGRGRSGRGRGRGPWNTDRGTQDGIDALCDAKEQYGKGGEGVREYADLVLKLVSMEGMDVARLVQDEVAEENAKIIAQLLHGDSY